MAAFQIEATLNLLGRQQRRPRLLKAGTLPGGQFILRRRAPKQGNGKVDQFVLHYIPYNVVIVITAPEY